MTPLTSLRLPVSFRHLSGLLVLTVIAVTLVIVLIKPPAGKPSEPRPPAITALARPRMNFDAAPPVSFEPNLGQAPRLVKFLSRSADSTLFLTSSEAVLSPHPARPRDFARPLRMRIVGANPNAGAAGLDEFPGKVNYFVGNHPEKWHTNIPTYARVKLTSVYPGIDLVYHEHRGQLEFDFLLYPGADVRKIRIAFPTASTTKLDEHGALLLRLGQTIARFQSPCLYQQIGSIKTPVDGRFTLHSDHTLGFAVAAYDKSKPLVIDPVLVYSTWLGGVGADRGTAIAVDAAGNAYITGSTTSPDFPGAHSGFPRSTGTDPDQPDVFVAKINATGSALVYFTYLGGSKFDGGIGIAINSAGEAYVTGYTGSPDFPTVDPIQAQHGGGYDAFVAKLNSTGSQLLYSTFLGGSGGDGAAGIAVDSSGSAYVTGFTGSPNFPISHPLQTSLKGPFDVFITKLSPDGKRLVYSTFLGGNRDDEGVAIAVDSAGNAYVTGSVTSSDFPTVNPIQSKFAGGVVDAFVLKLNPTGSALVYSTYLGGSSRDQGAGIAVDSSGDVYVTGFTGSTDFPVSHAVQPKLAGDFDAFVAKLNPTGSDLLYSTYLGGAGKEQGAAIAIDRAGNAFVTGFTASADFPVVSPLQPKLGGETDAFITQLKPFGSALSVSTFLGGSATDEGAGIAVDRSGNIYITGYTASPNFPTLHPLQHDFSGKEDAFLAKIAITDLRPHPKNQR
jgi:hypothetical protein